MAEEKGKGPHSDDLEQQQLKRLELTSFFEATTLVLLVCFAVPAKHLLGLPEATRYIGPIHGIAFLAYTWTALQTVAGGGWVWRDTARLILVAFIPFAGFVNIPWLRRRAVSTHGIQGIGS